MKTNTFEVNGKTYTAAPFSFNTMCDFEDMGVEITNSNKKPLSLIRAYFAISANISLDEAGNLLAGADMSVFNAIAEAMNKELEDSDFFRSVTQSKTEKVTEN